MNSLKTHWHKSILMQWCKRWGAACSLLLPVGASVAAAAASLARCGLVGSSRQSDLVLSRASIADVRYLPASQQILPACRAGTEERQAACRQLAHSMLSRMAAAHPLLLMARAGSGQQLGLLGTQVYALSLQELKQGLPLSALTSAAAFPGKHNLHTGQSLLCRSLIWVSALLVPCSKVAVWSACAHSCHKATFWQAVTDCSWLLRRQGCRGNCQAQASAG